MRLSNRDSISKIKIKWKLIHLSLLVYLMHNALESHMKLIPGFPACSDVGLNNSRTISQKLQFTFSQQNFSTNNYISR